MKKIYFFLVMLVAANGVWGQTSTQNFGTGTFSQTSQTGSTAVIPNPTGSGTTWARGGATAPNAPILGVNTSNPLGTSGTYVRAVASTSTSVAKFSPWVGYTGGTEFYTSFKILFGDASAGSTATSGIWNFYQGAGVMYSDANDFTGAQVFTGLRFTFGAAGAIALTYRGGGAFTTTGLTTTTFSSATIYTVEIVGNNKTSGTISYLYNGISQTVAVQKFDLYINGTLIGDDLAEAALPANTAIASGTFIGISSTSNVANVFVDDAVTYNAVPASIGVPPTPTTTLLTPSSATEGGPGFSLTVDGTNFFNGLSTVRWNGATRTTVFNSSTQLSATINAADIAVAGTATVDVITTGAAATSNTQTFTINAATTPLITLTPTSLSGFTYVAGAGPSGTQSFSVSGVNLTGAPGNIAVTAPADYEINDGGGWVSSFNIPYASATLGSTNVDVRLKAGLAVGTYNGELISVSGGGDSKNETVSGNVTLGTPVANAPTIFTATSFTADWAPGVPGATAGYLLDASAFSSFSAPGTINSEGFENSLSLFTETSGTGTFSTGSSTALDLPSNSPYAIAGTYSYGKSNGTVTITSSNINTSAASAVQMSCRLASFSVGSLANGADLGDIVTVEISPDGGTTFFSTVRVLGNNNAVWAYAATGVASTAYDGNATPVDFQPAGGGLRTTDGYSTVTVTGLPSVSNLKIRITLLNNNAAELWVIDDLSVTGTIASYLSGYNGLAVVGTSQSVTVPGPGTYYYRVRATTGVVTSANSNVVSVVMNDQNTSAFRSIATGNYSSSGTWEFNISGSTYTGATQAPGSVNAVTIQSGHTVTLSGAGAANNLTILASALLDLNGNTLTVNGNMSNGGALTTNLGTVDFAGTSGTQTLTTGGTGAGKTFYVLTHSGASTLQLATNNLRVNNNFTNNSGPFNGNGLNVSLGGDLSANGTYSSGGGILTFNGSADQNWGGAGGSDYGDVVINKSSGNAVLTGNVQANDLTLTLGKVVLGTNNLVVGGSVTGGTSSNYIVTDGTGVLTINNVTGAKTFPIGNAKYNPLTINNADGYNWSTKIADGLTADPGFNTDKAVLLTWNITPSVNPTATGTTVTFQYDEAATPTGQTGILYDNSETVQAWHKPNAGSGWVLTGSAVLPGGVAGATTVTVPGLQFFSPYALSNSSSPLPAKFSNVKAYQQGSNIRIDWTNLTETNVLNYVVERSSDGINFTAISTTGAVRNNGGRADYTSLDMSPLNGINFYRIHSNELDGRSLYSVIVKVNTKGGTAGIVIYPNPVSGGQLSLQTTGLNKGEYTIRIFNANGQQVYNQLLNHHGGAATEVIQLPAALKPGMYNLQLSGGEVKLAKSFIIR